MQKPNIEEMATFCKRKGFIYPNSEIYGGLAGFFDYGHLGVELKNNLKREWWKTHVQQRRDVVGMDGAIICNPRVWQASGHAENFADLMLTTKKSKLKIRADHFIESELKVPADGLNAQEINELIEKNDLKHNGEEFEKLTDFNLMFSTEVGANADQKSYLRPETAQLIFSNFKLVQENARMKLPFGIAQIGKAFRNEISPRDFTFRCREFEQMEIEYFVNPEDSENCPYLKDFEEFELNVLTEEMQSKKQQSEKMKVKQLVKDKIMMEWHAYWLAFEQQWLVSMGAKPENLRVRQHLQREKSHYAKDTWDLEYNFPFGWKELEGIANRGSFDLDQHVKESGKDMSYFDEERKKKVIPWVIAEPSLGLDRTFLVLMFDAYEHDEERKNTVLKLHPKITPVKVAVFPLVSNKKELTDASSKIYDDLKKDFNCKYDSSGSIGRRYSRADEEGTFLCCTVDFESLEDDSVTLRHRDTARQIRLKTSELKSAVCKLIEGADFESFGKAMD